MLAERSIIDDFLRHVSDARVDFDLVEQEVEEVIFNVEAGSAEIKAVDGVEESEVLVDSGASTSCSPVAPQSFPHRRVTMSSSPSLRLPCPCSSEQQ